MDPPGRPRWTLTVEGGLSLTRAQPKYLCPGPDPSQVQKMDPCTPLVLASYP